MKEHTEARDIHDGTNGADDQINQNLHRQRRRRRTVMEDTVEGPDTIFPLNFLTFLYGPRSKADCTFIDPASRLSNFCSHLRLEAKTVFSKINSLNDFPPKQLIASLHVGYIEIGEQIRNKCQGLIHPSVPEIKYTSGLRFQIPGSKYNICFII